MRKLALLLALAGGVLIGCGEKGEMVAPAPPMIRVDTVVVVDTIVRVDTVVVVDTIVRVDTVTVTDTLLRVDTVTVADTIMTVDTLLRVDTVTVADTIMTVDTLVRVDTVRVSTPTHKREWTPDVTRSAAAAMFNPFTRIAAGSSIAACGVAGRVYVVSDTGELVWDDCEERGWYFNGRATEVLANNLQTTSGRLRFASYATDETCDFVEEITSTRLAITICDVPFEVTRSSDESSSRLRVR